MKDCMQLGLHIPDTILASLLVVLAGAVAPALPAARALSRFSRLAWLSIGPCQAQEHPWYTVLCIIQRTHRVFLLPRQNDEDEDHLPH